MTSGCGVAVGVAAVASWVGTGVVVGGATVALGSGVVVEGSDVLVGTEVVLGGSVTLSRSSWPVQLPLLSICRPMARSGLPPSAGITQVTVVHAPGVSATAGSR